jgi:putative ABC transport system ATP-binding protein
MSVSIRWAESACLSRATQPVPRVMPYSDDRLSPTTKMRRAVGDPVCPQAVRVMRGKKLKRARLTNRRSKENEDMDAEVNAIEVKQLSKRVQDAAGMLTILDDISFSLRTGESLAITGASGSGKSTLLGLLAGLDTPTSGQVTLLGQLLFALDEDGRAALRARSIGFVFQSFHLLPNLNALENVMLPLELAGREALEPATALLQRVGLGERLHHFPSTLSGGEQQRVSLARAFAQQPSVLFADEPTGSLDEVTGAKIIDLMFEFQRTQQTTLVLVTHDPQLAGRCDRQLVMQGGRLAAGA